MEEQFFIRPSGTVAGPAQLAIVGAFQQHLQVAEHPAVVTDNTVPVKGLACFPD
jgi:hypothetical protein